ncbi:MAG: hypothetical protein ABIU05_03945 [Nitrospirales bacterium]
MPLPTSYPQVVSGYPSEKEAQMDARLTMSGMTDWFPHPRHEEAGIYRKICKDGCPIKNVGMTDWFRHPRMSLAGIHPKKAKMDAR